MTGSTAIIESEFLLSDESGHVAVVTAPAVSGLIRVAFDASSSRMPAGVIFFEASTTTITSASRQAAQDAGSARLWTLAGTR